tara:strand:- start:404 stop:769 length:366 start_codon:yes stop_codon:yes gene_type:complete
MIYLLELNNKLIFNPMMLLLVISIISVMLAPIPVFGASESASLESSGGFFPNDPEAAKVIAAGLAFGMGSIAAGFAVGKAGAAGMAAVAERPETKTTAIIITALGEALAIYALVIALLLVG